MTTPTRAGALRATMRKIEHHIRQAQSLAETVGPQIAELTDSKDDPEEPSEGWDPAELDAYGQRTGLLITRLAVMHVCATWQSPGAQEKVDEILALADDVSLRTSAVAMANMIIEYERWTGSLKTTHTGN